ncbi:hypothetical protein E1212_13560 [Jiangella ureilytica]|uniref:Alpha/beta hydrolase n=1 Tax=Jiangella ureilytica TaxID=2530374 RepID=A0A4R4RNE6_9ACTN|nr:hypothetical protein [Jiangella ureilytica]TDC50964.1 hypothetical protein E1212_13560 [Jiangella ureilytica]
MGTSARRGIVPAATAVLSSALLAALIVPSPAGAAPAPPEEPATEVAAGPNWSVERAPGGYQVTVELDRPLPIRGDAPTIVVDGEPIGLATESGDGRSLTVVTADPAVAAADTVVPGWSSEAPAATPPAATAGVAAVPDAAIAEIAADPLVPGSYDWTESIYAFGDQAVPLAAIGGIRGELEGKLYLPTTGGARPTVILLHGRHGSCYGAGEANPNRWPCAPSPDADPARLSIPSYLGYDGTARALASHGYAVVSISANAVNANDNQLAADQGAQARGRLLLDTLTMLDDATNGRRVAYHDAWTDREVTLNQALAAGSAALAARADAFPGGVDALDTVRAADLRGRFDLRHIGMMGHSRGGEGVTSATVLNQALERPWAIESILPLAPVDFGRMTVPDVPMNVILPYCDGDVSNQQGQHMLDDSRYAFDDDVLRSGVWVMGANHNFFNTVWTPGLFSFSVSDDWGSAARRVEPTCGTDPSVAATSIRLTPAEQYDVGTAYMSAWFRLTLGGEEEFLPLFDGSGAVPSSLGGADVRSVSTAPAGSRSTLASFESPSPAVTTVGAASAVVCASLSGRTVPQALPPCASVPSAVAPHWTPASNGGNVPATPLTRLTWTAPGDGLAVSVPAGQRDASGFDRLSVKLAADETVDVATDLVLSVTDGAGVVWSAPISELNPYALVRLPTSDSDAAASTLKKIVLQQADVPVTALAAAGLDVTDVASVRLVGAGGSGAAYVSDLAFESSAVGTARARTWRTIDVFAPNTDEGDGPGATDVAVYLDRPSTTPVTGYVSVLGSATSRFGATMQAVTFAPGETCKVVSAGRQGDDAASASAGTQVKASVINTSGAVMGSRSIGFTWLREDDGVLEEAVELPSYGTPGSACTELARVQAGVRIGARGAVRPGSAAAVTAAGFRPGETVTVTVGDLPPVDVVADASGAVAHTVAVPAVVGGRFLVLTGVGAGTGLTATGQLVVTSPGR